jgi:hypothetical protein
MHPSDLSLTSATACHRIDAAEVHRNTAPCEIRLKSTELEIANVF